MSLVFALMLLVLRCGWCAITINVNTVSLSNTLTLTSNVLYSLNMTFASITVPAASSILMQFTIHYTIDVSTLSNCKYSITGASYTDTTCTPAYNSQNNQYEITFPGIYPSTATAQSSLFLQFSITNPQFAATEYINLFIMSGSSSLATGLISITYDASPLNSCSYTSSNQTTGVNSTRTISFFPSAPVFAGSTFVMTLPPWFGTLSSNPISLSGGTLTCAGISNSDSAVPGCNSNVYQDSTTSIYYEQIDVTGLITSSKTLASAITFTATALRNPPSLAPFGPIIFQLKIPDPNSGGALTTSQTCSGIYQTVTSMNAPTSISFAINTTLAISTPYTSKTARLTINNPFPSTGQLKVSFPSSVTMLYVPTTYPVATTSTSLTFSNVQSSDLIGSGTITVPGITITTPPSSRPFTVTINSQNVVGGTVYGIDSSSITFTCLTGTLTATSLVPTVTSVNAITQHVLGFTTANALTAASFVAINFPAQLTATVGSCTTNHTNITCTVSNTSYASLAVTGAVAKLTAIRVTFPSVKNPKQTQTTASFQIYTYYDAGLDSMVDRVTTGITMTSTPNAVVSATVAPTSLVTYALTTYTFNVQLADPIPANGYIQIIFPATVSFGTLAIASASFATTTCTLSLVSFTLSINNCFSADMSTLTTSIAISGVYNPPSLQPTASFSFSTFGPLGMVNFINSGLTTTMTTPATTTAFSISPLSNVVHSTQQYNLGFSFAVPHQSGDYFTLTVPASMTISASPSCSGLSGITNVSCVLLNTTSIKVNLNAVPLTVSQIAIFSIRNYDIATSVSYQAFFYDSGNFAMETTTATAVTYTPAAISTFSLNNNNQIALYENSNITITLSTPFALDSSFTPALASLTVTPPATFAITANTTCASSAGSCTQSSGSFTVSAVGLSLTSQTVTISNIVLPYFAASSTSFTLTYLYNSMQVATVSSGVTLSVFCTSPCERCTSSQTTCASCLPIANTALIYLFTVNSSCLGSCPDTYYTGTGNICQPCNSPCLWCSDSVNCTKCSNTTYLFSSTCLAVCPATYFGNSSNICDSCVSPCANCTSLTACLSCSVNFFTNFSCVTAANCPAGTYGDIPSKTCSACTSPCANCFDTATNCTSCVAGFVYFANTCPSVCPSTYYNSSNICTACVSPCGNCTSASTCTSCTLNFFTNFSCVTAASCPAGTYGDVPSKTCAGCTSPCANCVDSATNCTSCVSGFVYFQNTCPSVCPSTYYNSSNSCTACVSPCGNCTSSTNCLSCTTNYLSGTSCVSASSCPAGTFADNLTNTCATCPTGCSGCQSTTFCSSCTSFFLFYNFTCVVGCPNITYQSGSSCIACSPSCLTCSGSASTCTACSSPSLLYGSLCVASCPNGTYTSSSSCLNCLSTCLTCNSGSTCSSCSGSLFLSGTHCLSSCSGSTFQDLSSNNCSACDPSCLTCSATATNCTTCIPSLVFSANTCIASCPANYFNISGICKTCGNCLSCTSVTTCTNCLPGYYIFAGACYSSCPPGSIFEALTQTCSQCNSSCASCSGTASNCLSCAGSLFLLNGVCVSSCPSGYIASAGTCTASTIGNIIYFPFSITFAVIAVIVLYSKSNHPKTQTATTLCGILAFLAWISWFALAISAATADLLLQASALSVILGVSMVGIIASALLGTVFAVWFRNYFKADNGFSQWINHTSNNLYVFRGVFTFTLFSFPLFRLLYCRFFTRNQLSAFFVKGADLLNASAKFAFLHTLLCLFPMLFVSGYVVYIKRQYDQTLINAIDSLLLNILLAILLIIDTNSKDDSYFAQMIEDQPYLKKFAYDELNHSLSSLRDYDDAKKQRHHSQLNQREKEEFFREKITIIDNVNKFGHLDTPIPEEPGKSRKIKTLPDDLQNLPQFDLHEDQIKVIDEDFFFQEDEKRRRREQEEEEERMRLAEEERLRKEKEEEEQREREKEKKRRLMEDDMDQQHSVEFPDLAAIEKVEKKGESLKKSPTHILSNFKKVQDRAIPQKQQKKLQDIAKKNGIDPQFMAETFGIQKHHNPQLLNSIIDKHFHVDREAVKALFSASSNPELLQELFSKKSTMNADRLRSLMNDPESAEIIKNLASAEDGIVSAQIAKMLMEGNGKFSEEFVKELLTCGGGGMDAAKLKQLLRDQPDKIARQASLKAMKKLGGDSLQNKEMMKNLLGQESLLQADNFNRVANQLPKKVLEQLFGSKSHTNDVIISKLLNNKKIDLKNLSTILQDPQLVDELAKALSSGNKELQENLMNLFKNGEKLDPQLLKEFLTRPGLMEKLASHPVDPVFLSNLLKKDAQTDLSLLQRTLQKMSPEQIAEVFEFNPEKNIDFQKVAKLFEFNSKTDPALVAELLDPQIVEHIYNKASSARPEILNKLVQKGKRIDPESIIKIYGDDAKTGFREGESANKKYNITENNFNLSKEDFDDQLGFKKANEVNMSRTDGRMLGFLSPIQVGMQRNRKYSKNGQEGGRGREVGMSPNEMDDIDDEEITEYNYAEGEKKQDDEEYQEVQEGGKRRRRKKPKKKPLDDIRLPSQHIYLQRLQAPHQKKKNIRKKKKASSSMQQLQPMNQDNQVYDLDF